MASERLPLEMIYRHLITVLGAVRRRDGDLLIEAETALMQCATRFPTSFAAILVQLENLAEDPVAKEKGT